MDNFNNSTKEFGLSIVYTILVTSFLIYNTPKKYIPFYVSFVSISFWAYKFFNRITRVKIFNNCVEIHYYMRFRKTVAIINKENLTFHFNNSLEGRIVTEKLLVFDKNRKFIFSSRYDWHPSTLRQIGLSLDSFGYKKINRNE